MHCEFQVWAPLAQQVLVELEGDPGRQVALARGADGYHAATLDDMRAGLRYRFIVDGKAVPDPWSRYQPEGPHGPSQIVDTRAYAWTDAQWPGIGLEGLVIYEVHVGSFTPEGTFAAATGKLRHLLDLGINAIEVMPVAECPGRFNWGYDGVGWFAPSHNYGSYEAFKAFVDAAHGLGLGVILDVVYNHFGPDGNYLAHLSDQYLSRKGTDWGEAINFDGAGSGPVRDPRHCQRLRMDPRISPRRFATGRDAKHFRRIAAPMCWRNSQRLRAPRRTSRHRHHCRERAATRLAPAGCAHGGMGLDAMWNDDFHHAAMVAATGRREAYYRDYFGSPQEFVSAAKRGFLFQGQFYHWQKQNRGEPLTGSPKHCVAFLQNHDQVANSLSGLRLHQLTSAGIHRALTAMLLLGPQTPLLFMGQEFSATAPFLFFADHQDPAARPGATGPCGITGAVSRRRFRGWSRGTGGSGIGSHLHALQARLDECRPDNPALRLHADLAGAEAR